MQPNLNISNKVRGIAILTGVAVLGDAMLFVVLPIYWREFGLSALWQIGLLLSINRLIRLPVNPLVGLFYKHFQLRTGVLLALGIAVVTTASYGLLQEFWSLLIMRACWGVGWSLLRLGGFLSIVNITDDTNRGRYIGLYNGLWGLGSLAGMLSGGILVDQTSVLFVTTLFSVIGLCFFPFIWMIIPPQDRHQEEVNTQLAGIRVRSPYFLLILLTGGSVGLVIFGLFSSTLSPLIGRIYTGDWSFLTLVIGAATLTGLIQAIRWGWEPFVAPFYGKKIDSNHSKYPFLLIPLFIAGCLFMVLGNLQSIGLLFIFLLIFQISSTLLVTATDTFAANAAAQTDRVRAMTLYTIFVDVGAALGPLLSYIIMSIYEVSVVYFIAGGLLLVISLVWFIFMRSNPFSHHSSADSTAHTANKE
ncbi:MFS transporter [Paenibacillus sp. QZ-Y1]|uniref:MFS transporter n=1 Tax=Paenibacillus sp. QZ-Y1 TaxID=3414511 RepID=UPI003F78C187